MTRLMIVYEHGGKALALTTVEDVELLQLAARRAIEVKREYVRRATSLDAQLGAIAERDCRCLEAKLAILVPGLLGQDTKGR